ncbi:MAG: hypothetical protein ACTHJK_14095, partial [Sphingomicrobium sp.]
MTTGEKDRGGGIGGFGVAEEEEKPLGGTGGGAGGGTRAGEGQPSGEGIGTDDLTDSEAAREAAALGELDDHDETAALEYGEGDRPRGPTIGEALGTGAGTHVGSGTPEDEPIGEGPFEEEV